MSDILYHFLYWRQKWTFLKYLYYHYHHATLAGWIQLSNCSNSFTWYSFLTKFIWLCLFDYKYMYIYVYLIHIVCISAFKFHTRLIVLRVTMDQTAQLTVPVIQENVLLMGIITVKWVRLYTQVKQYGKILCYLIRIFKKLFLVTNRMDR